MSERRPREGELRRETRETAVEARLLLDGQGGCEVATGVGFLDHMLELFARHALVDIRIAARGDLQVDAHHTVEDTGLVLGSCIDRALGDRAGIRRYGWALVPMDEALARVVVDLSGRPYFVYRAEPPPHGMVGSMPVQLVEEFWRAVATNGRMTLHIELLYGRDLHHLAEAVFKGAARALAMAWERDPRVRGVPSTKGVL